MFILAHGVDHCIHYKFINSQKKKTICGHISLHLPFLLIFGIQVEMAYLFWLAYGTMAFLLGPLRTWSLLLAAILWFFAINLPEKCTRLEVDFWGGLVFISLLQESCNLTANLPWKKSQWWVVEALTYVSSSVNVLIFQYRTKIFYVGPYTKLQIFILFVALNKLLCLYNVIVRRKKFVVGSCDSFFLLVLL